MQLSEHRLKYPLTKDQTTSSLITSSGFDGHIAQLQTDSLTEL